MNIGHHCKAAIVTCIDFRFQEIINNWISENLEPKSFDRIALAGGVKNLELIMEQVSTSQKLHDIKRVILINHQDCGAYGEEGTREVHTTDLQKTAETIKGKFPELKIEKYYLHLDGSSEQVN